jgi:hypothetical protein
MLVLECLTHTTHGSVCTAGCLHVPMYNLNHHHTHRTADRTQQHQEGVFGPKPVTKLAEDVEDAEDVSHASLLAQGASPFPIKGCAEILDMAQDVQSSSESMAMRRLNDLLNDRPNKQNYIATSQIIRGRAHTYTHTS